MGEKAELSVEVTQPAVSCSWTKERRVLLVMSKAKRKWVSVRPLPSIRNFPQQYDVSTGGGGAGWHRGFGCEALGPRRAWLLAGAVTPSSRTQQTLSTPPS